MQHIEIERKRWAQDVGEVQVDLAPYFEIRHPCHAGKHFRTLTLFLSRCWYDFIAEGVIRLTWGEGSMGQSPVVIRGAVISRGIRLDILHIQLGSVPHVHSY